MIYREKQYIKQFRETLIQSARDEGLDEDAVLKTFASR